MDHIYVQDTNISLIVLELYSVTKNSLVNIIIDREKNVKILYIII
jgi:hypothetical protein